MSLPTSGWRLSCAFQVDLRPENPHRRIAYVGSLVSIDLKRKESLHPEVGGDKEGRRVSCGESSRSREPKFANFPKVTTIVEKHRGHRTAQTPRIASNEFSLDGRPL